MRVEAALWFCTDSAYIHITYHNMIRNKSWVKLQAKEADQAYKTERQQEVSIWYSKIQLTWISLVESSYVFIQTESEIDLGLSLVIKALCCFKGWDMFPKFVCDTNSKSEYEPASIVQVQPISKHWIIILNAKSQIRIYNNEFDFETPSWMFLEFSHLHFANWRSTTLRRKVFLSCCAALQWWGHLKLDDQSNFDSCGDCKHGCNMER